MNGRPICRRCDDVCHECGGTGECMDCENYGCESCELTGDCPCCDGGCLVDENGHRR